MTKRRNFSDKFKAAVMLETLRSDMTVQEIAAKRQLHPTQVSTWKRQAIEGMASVFSGEIKDLHANIGQLAVENGFFVTRAEAMSPSERRDMIRKQNTKLSLTRQCKLLKISRSSLYYTPVGVNAETLKLMHEIGRVFTKYPFFPFRNYAAQNPVGQWQPPDRSRPSPIRVLSWKASSAPTDVHYGIEGRIQGAKHKKETSSAPHLSVEHLGFFDRG